MLFSDTHSCRDVCARVCDFVKNFDIFFVYDLCYVENRSEEIERKKFPQASHHHDRHTTIADRTFQSFNAMYTCWWWRWWCFFKAHFSLQLKVKANKVLFFMVRVFLTPPHHIIYINPYSQMDIFTFQSVRWSFRISYILLQSFFAARELAVVSSSCFTCV